MVGIELFVLNSAMDSTALSLREECMSPQRFLGSLAKERCEEREWEFLLFSRTNMGPREGRHAHMSATLGSVDVQVRTVVYACVGSVLVRSRVASAQRRIHATKQTLDRSFG